MTPMERYLITLQHAKASFRAYTAAPSDQTFVMACEAVNDHQEARTAFLNTLQKGSQTDPFHQPHTDT